MRRLIRRCIAVAVASIAISLFVSAVPAAQAAPVNCTRQTHKGACYEFVWVHGVQVRMTFPQAGTPLPTIPNAKVQNFYVIAAQTSTPTRSVEVHTWYQPVRKVAARRSRACCSWPANTTQVSRRAATSPAIEGPPMAAQGMRARSSAGIIVIPPRAQRQRARANPARTILARRRGARGTPEA